MILRYFTAFFVLIMSTSAALAFDECPWQFDLDFESSASLQIMNGAQNRGGLWQPIRHADSEIQKIAKFVGRLDVCFRTNDGLPRRVRLLDGTTAERSANVFPCTASLMPGNLLLTAHHCFHDTAVRESGFTEIDQVRINFNYTDSDLKDHVITFPVDKTAVDGDASVDALVLRIFGGDANKALGGHVPMLIDPDLEPRQALVMIHHPMAQPQMFSDGTCRIDPRQVDVPESSSALRHRCETTGGSSGSLIFDARSLHVVGLHNTGGLGQKRGFNGGHKIAMVEDILKLGFQVASNEQSIVNAPASAESRAALAFVRAQAASDPAEKIALLKAVVTDFPDTEGAALAALELRKASDAVEEEKRRAEAEAERERRLAEAEAAAKAEAELERKIAAAEEEERRLAEAAAAAAAEAEEKKRLDDAIRLVMEEEERKAEAAALALAEEEEKRRAANVEAGKAVDERQETERLADRALAAALLEPTSIGRLILLERVKVEFKGTVASARAAAVIDDEFWNAKPSEPSQPAECISAYLRAPFAPEQTQNSTPQFTPGEPVGLCITLAERGYVTIYNAPPAGNFTQLFPTLQSHPNGEQKVLFEAGREKCLTRNGNDPFFRPSPNQIGQGKISITWTHPDLSFGQVLSETCGARHIQYVNYKVSRSN